MNDGNSPISIATSVTLSDRSIEKRLTTYNGDGTFERDLNALWDRASRIMTEVGSEHWTKVFANFARQVGRPLSGPSVSVARQQEVMRRKFSGKVDRDWIRLIAAQGGEMFSEKVPTPVVVLAVSGFACALIERLRIEFPGDTELMESASRLLDRLNCIELEILFAEINKRERLRAAESLVLETGAFREQVVAILHDTLRSSAGLRDRSVQSSDAARGMLGKTSEVAAAAEQSAVAMREAAQTAAGLIRAIEDARSEVEVAAGIATRAADQSARAVIVSEALSDHAKAIESILGLIRDIAGQTNLLALNATIEAARAGDAGRGFAVVAQEVKSLANQTARATDDIAAKIAAIQTATRQTVEANGSIRETVGDVQASAQRIRMAMEVQAQTVTMITAAVDETALAADSMSDTIAAIRIDTVGIAGEIDQLAAGFRDVDSQLSSLDHATSEFVSRIAA